MEKYLKPEMDIIEVEVEGAICASPADDDLPGADNSPVSIFD